MLDKIFGESKGIFKTVSIIESILAILFLIAGLIFFTNESISYLLLCIITGILIIGVGISSIYSFIKREEIVLFNLNLIFGIVFIIVGIISFFVNYNLNYVCASFLIISGLKKIVYSIYLKKFNESSWLFNLVMGILFIALGVITCFTSVDNTITVVGIDLIGYALLDLTIIILLARRSKYFLL